PTATNDQSPRSSQREPTLLAFADPRACRTEKRDPRKQSSVHLVRCLRTIELVSQNRATHGRQLGADLVGSSRLEINLDFKQRPDRPDTNHAQRTLQPIRLNLGTDHLRAAFRGLHVMDVPSDVGRGTYQCEVPLLHLSLEEKPIELALKLLCFRKDQQPADFRIESLGD